MSAIAGCFGSLADRVDDVVLRRAFEAMPGRSDCRLAIWRSPLCVIAVARFPWETSPELAGPATVGRRGRWTVATDASLYYRADLARTTGLPLAATVGVPAHDAIAAVLAATGPDGVRHLEGDFAFVAWDGEQLCMARDFAGSRPLHFARVGDSVVVASRAGGVLAFPGVSGQRNVVAIAEIAASQFAVPGETAFRDVTSVAAAETVTWSRNGTLTSRRHWEVPEFQSERRPATPLTEAALELRGLLEVAARERTTSSPIVATHLSGGWDSTAVAASLRRATTGSATRVVAVSADYPPGDSGHESGFVLDTSRHLGCELLLLPGSEAPFLENGLGEPYPDDPFAHVFAGFNSQLARGAVGAGAHVVMTGWGGDQLFGAGLGYLADLFTSGRWREARAEFSSFGGKGRKHFLSAALLPALPGFLRVPAARALRAPADPYMTRPIPSWVDPGFSRRFRLRDRQNVHLKDAVGRHLSNFETRTLVAHPYFPRIYAVLAELHLRAGCEVRSPLFDRRVVAFAATRPRAERVGQGETKQLLRAAMRSELPPSVLSPRPTRTGTLDTYLEQSFRQHLSVLEELSPANTLISLGITTKSLFSEFSKPILEGSSGAGRLELVHALQVETWLRGFSAA